MKLSLVMVITLAVMRFAVFASDAPQPATLPYRTLCQMAQLDLAETTDFTNHPVSFKVGSKNPGVELKDIAMFIDSKSGRIPLSIDTNGVMALPISNDLLQENPNVVANQPKGSMTMEVSAQWPGWRIDMAKKLKSGHVRYNDLFLLARIRQDWLLQGMALMDGVQSPSEEAVGLIDEFKRLMIIELTPKTTGSSKPSILIERSDGAQELQPDKQGKFQVEYEETLVRENPWIRLSTNHEWVVTDRPKTEAKQRAEGDGEKPSAP